MWDLDNHKLHLHPLEVVSWKHDQITPPLTVEISPTNRCNQRCSFCAFDYRRGTVDLDMEEVGDMMSQSTRTPASITLGGEGEPTLNKGIWPFAHRMGIRTAKIGLITNGTDESLPDHLFKLTWIRFSINALDPATFAAIHGVAPTERTRIMTMLERCCEVKNQKALRTTIGVQAVLLEENLGNLAALAAAVRSTGADYFVVKPASAHPQSECKRASPWLTDDQLDALERDLSSLRTPAFSPVIRRRAFSDLSTPRHYKGCPAAAFFAFIASDGRVYPCAQFVGKKEFCMGDITLQTWYEIVGSKKRRWILDRLDHDYPTESCRRPCRLDAANEYLHRLQHPEPHDDFL